MIVGDGRAPIERGAFVVQKGRVTAVGERGSVSVPSDATRVDLTGKTVMPAIVNAHVHLGFQRGAGVCGRKLHARQHPRPTETATRSPASPPSCRSAPTLRRFPYAIRAAQRDGTSGGRAVPDGRPRYRAAGRRAGQRRHEAVGLRRAHRSRRPAPRSATQAARGVDVIKIWVDDRNGSVPKAQPGLARAVIDEAHRHKLKRHRHIFYLDDAKWLARAGVNGFAHLVRDREADDELVTLMRDNGVVIIPNMAISQNGMLRRAARLARRPAVPRASRRPRTIERHSRRRSAAGRPQAVERARADGSRHGSWRPRIEGGRCEFAFGTDGGAAAITFTRLTDASRDGDHGRGGPDARGGVAGRDETSAETLGLDDLGASTPGKSADFIVLDANPLEDIRNTRRIARVYLRGGKIDREAL